MCFPTTMHTELSRTIINTGNVLRQSYRDFRLIKEVYAERAINNAIDEDWTLNDDIDHINEFVIELQASQGFVSPRSTRPSPSRSTGTDSLDSTTPTRLLGFTWFF